MGAEIFIVEAGGKTPSEAFRNAVDDARHYYGHRPYTGSIAEKDGFIIINLPTEGTNPEEYAYKLIDECDPRIDDKWGPAGCIKIEDGRYLFFGWASS